MVLPMRIPPATTVPRKPRCAPMASAAPADALSPLRPALRRGLDLMRAWFHRMVDPSTQRLYYEYLPRERRHVHEHSPIRELGTCADLGTLQRFLGATEFDPVIDATLARYERALLRERTFEEEPGVATAEGLGATETEVEREEEPLPRAWLRAQEIGEPSSVAHSSMMILALAAYERYPDEQRKEALLQELGDGIAHQQRPDGSLRVYFEPASLPDHGWELYYGEAALALAAAYTRLGEERLLSCAAQVLAACRRDYLAGGVRPSALAFFANWQCQAARAVLRHTLDAADAGELAGYVFSLQAAALGDGEFERRLEQAQEEVATVEVACTLEGLADAYAVALERGETRHVAAYGRAIAAAVAFLGRVQVAPGAGAPEAAVGGFGHGFLADAQRVDVTGHVCSAYVKLLELLGEGAGA